MSGKFATAIPHPGTPGLIAHPSKSIPACRASRTSIFCGKFNRQTTSRSRSRIRARVRRLSYPNHKTAQAPAARPFSKTSMRDRPSSFESNGVYGSINTKSPGPRSVSNTVRIESPKRVETRDSRPWDSAYRETSFSAAASRSWNTNFVVCLDKHRIATAGEPRYFPSGVSRTMSR